MEVKIEKDLFSKRLKKLYDKWQTERKQEGSVWGEADSLLVTLGQTEEDSPYKKSSALCSWFWGREFSETIFLLTQSSLCVLTSAKRVNFLESANLASGLCVELQLIPRQTNDSSNYTTLIEAAKKSHKGAKVGTLVKEKPVGEFADKWNKELTKSNLTLVDIAQGLASIFSVKDDAELKYVKTASQISSIVLKKILVPKIETIIDEEKQEKHANIADLVEEIFGEPTKISTKLTNADSVDSCYTPIIQSGGKYDLKPSAVSNEDKLHFGVIVCSLGARYRLYCSNVARTYFVDAKKEHKDVYELVLTIQKQILDIMKPGVKLSRVMETARASINNSHPDLLQYFVKNCGFGMGLEFRESSLILSQKNDTLLEAGMVFNLSIGFQDVPLKEKTDDEKLKLYSILLADTILITQEGTEVLTNVRKKYSDVSYSVRDVNDDEPREEIPIIKNSVPITTRLRERDDSSAKMPDEKRKQHQQELARKKLEEAQERFLKDANGAYGDKNKNAVRTIAYENPSQYPLEAIPGKIYIDTKNESILLPIYGMLVPFHISTIKSESKSDDSYLRINFNPAPNRPDSQSILSYIKEVTFKISDAKELANHLRMIKELRKRVTTRNTQSKDIASLVAQEDLILNKGGRNPRLTDLILRPNPTGRRTMGALEAHKNGLRFSSNKGFTVDILYKNIKYAFYQPADNELIVILHFHLHNAIMIGKKKTMDVQFYSEVTEMSQSLDQINKRNVGDADELEEEQKERQLRNHLNETFNKFVKRVEEVVPDGLEFDIPYRDLGFYGVPARSSVFLQPTAYCLVHLVEPPFFVLPLDEIEIARFERVQFSLKNFDIAFVFKDFAKPVCHINSVPMESLDMIKEWLDSSNIKYYEGPTSLNWSRVLNVVRADPKGFFDQGGWDTILSIDSDQETDESDEDEDDEAYHPEEVEEEEEEGSDDDEEYSGSDDDDDEYGDDDDDDDDDEGEEEEEEALTWEEMEEQAKREDRDRKKRKAEAGESDSEEDKRKPKKKKPAPK